VERPVPGREFHPLKSSAFSRRTVSTTALRAVDEAPHTFLLIPAAFARDPDDVLASLKTEVAHGCRFYGGGFFAKAEDMG